MAEFKFVINDTKTGKSYKKNMEDTTVIGKQIGDKIQGDFLALDGYELEIRGGTDFAGFAMKNGIDGSKRKRPLLSKGLSMRTNRHGLKRRKTVCGNTISENISQVNLKVSKYGPKSLEEHFAPPKEEAPAEAAAE